MNLVSLDAPIIAVVWQCLFAKSFERPLDVYACAALALSVWFIYLADRLLDTRNPHQSHAAARHEFCRTHWHAMLSLAIAVLFMLGWVCARLDQATRRDGFVLLLFVAAYFGVVHVASRGLRRLWPKELIVGVVFSIGTCLPVWADDPQAHLTLVAPGILFGMLCALNCIAIEYWERHRHRLAPDTGFHRISYYVSRRLGRLSGMLAGICAAFFVLASVDTHALFLALFLSAVLLLALTLHADRISTDALRVLADAVLLTPVVAYCLISLR